MRKIFLVFAIIILLSVSYTVEADPTASFTWTSTQSKTVLTPILNNEVDEYKWTILGKRNGYNSETDWIDYDDSSDHISRLETGTYFVTITGRNIASGLEAKFTNAVKVTVSEDYVPSEEAEEEVEIESMIIENLPEPFRSFLKERSQFELLLIVLSIFLVMLIVTKRKKINRYMKLERFYDR